MSFVVIKAHIAMAVVQCYVVYYMQIEQVSNKQILEKVETLSEQVNKNSKKIDRNTKSISSLEVRVSRVEHKLDVHEEKLDKLDIRTNKIYNLLDKVYGVVINIQEKQTFMRNRLDNHELRITKLESSSLAS